MLWLSRKSSREDNVVNRERQKRRIWGDTHGKGMDGRKQQGKGLNPLSLDLKTETKREGCPGRPRRGFREGWQTRVELLLAQ